jgi:hypothetical protein
MIGRLLIYDSIATLVIESEPCLYTFLFLYILPTEQRGLRVRLCLISLVLLMILVLAYTFTDLFFRVGASVHSPEKSFCVLVFSTM